jgi:hypothetical protein
MGSQSKINKARRELSEVRNGESTVIGYLHPGMVSAYFNTSLIGTLLYDRVTSRRVVNIFNEWSSANVSAARNSIVEKFLATDASWFLFIDSDMAWEPDALDQLHETADEVERPIVGGLCFGASGDQLWPTIYQLGKVDGRATTVRINDYPRDSVVQVAATGAAFLMMHRSALESIRDKGFNRTFPWFQETEMDGKPVGEDLTFALRAGMTGLSVFVDTRIKVGHHKSHLLTEDLFLTQHRSPDA